MEITADILEYWFNSHLQQWQESGRLRGIFEGIELTNKAYGGAWEQDGLLTSLSDLKDKLYRVGVIVELGHTKRASYVRGQTITIEEKLDDILADILIRAMMTIMKKEDMESDVG